MAIAVLLNAAYDIETFDGLVAFVTAHLELDSETAAQVPTFIRLAEYRLNRLVTAPERETSASVSASAGNDTATLPADYRQLRNARLVADSGYTLEQVTPHALYDLYGNSTGKPVAYTITDDALIFGPVPDDDYTIRVIYKAKVPSLSSTNQTNWLLASNADAYLYATLWQAAAWLEDIDAATAFRAELMAIIEELNYDGNRKRNGGPMTPRVHGVP